MESCDYAIKIFNNIRLYDQPLRVQFSQNSNLSQQQQKTNESSNRMSRNTSSTGLNNRNQSQYAPQPLMPQQPVGQFLAPALMNFVAPLLMNQQFSQQPSNSFHRYLFEGLVWLIKLTRVLIRKAHDRDQVLIWIRTGTETSETIRVNKTTKGAATI